MAERNGRFATLLNGPAAASAAAGDSAAPVQLCKDPATIGANLDDRNRLQALKTYAQEMFDKAMERGNAVADHDETLAEMWWNIADLFEHALNNLSMFKNPTDEEVASLVESGAWALEDPNAAYSNLKEKTESSQSKSDVASKSKEKGASTSTSSNNNNASDDDDDSSPKSFASELGFPDRMDLHKQNVKGKPKLSSKVRSKIVGICKDMAGLKALMVSAQEDDFSAHVTWVELFHSLVEYIRKLAKEQPEQYLALLNAGVIGEIEEMKKLTDKGVMCNEELPNNIIARL